MLVLLSPAMRMRHVDAPFNLKLSTPYFLEEAHKLASAVKSLDFDEFSKLIKVKGEACAEFYVMWQDFATTDVPDKDRLTAAALSFDGIAFKHLKPEECSEEMWHYAQEHLRIASGLYGLLRPLDAVQAYRLEMQARLQLEGAKNLFKFWDNKLIDCVFNEAETLILNLTSHEYTKALLRDEQNSPQVLSADFKILGKNGYYTQSTWAKIGRGSMASYVLKHQIQDPQDLKNYNRYGYRFSPELSSQQNYVFIADEPYLE